MMCRRVARAPSRLPPRLNPARPLARWVPYLALALIVGLWVAAHVRSPAVAVAANRGVAGRILDEYGEPIRDARLRLYVNREDEPIAETHSQPDGEYVLILPGDEVASSVRIEVERAHFWTHNWSPEGEELAILLAEGSFLTRDIVLERRITISFWITNAIFVGMLGLIANERFHNTLAALLAVATIFAVSFIGGALNPNLYIFNFEQALGHVDFEVIFLLLGMMIVIGIIEETGIFQWLAYQAYRLSRGHAWRLTIILMLIAAATSALLDNVTTMLLMSPIILEIALVVGMNPLALVMPALLASNVGGLATLVGTPVNIMVGSYAGLSFNDFLVNQTPGVILAEAGLIAYVLLRYRKEYRRISPAQSANLLKQLEANTRIEDPAKLRKAGIVFTILLLLFVFGETIHLTPAVSALIAAVAMLIWVNPDIDAMMTVVDWTTLIFFIGLFMVIGAVREVGLISLIAAGMERVVGNSAWASVLSIVWMAAIFSGVIDNIPFAAAMLPVGRALSRSVPGLAGNALYYALALGSDLGGNSSLIASSANLVVAGITERAGYPITFMKFLRIGLPATLVTVTLGSVWLILRFIV